MKVRKAIQRGVKIICDQLDKMAVNVKDERDVRNLALVSRNYDEDIADVLALIYQKVGL